MQSFPMQTVMFQGSPTIWITAPADKISMYTSFLNSLNEEERGELLRMKQMGFEK